MTSRSMHQQNSERDATSEVVEVVVQESEVVMKVLRYLQCKEGAWGEEKDGARRGSKS